MRLTRLEEVDAMNAVCPCARLHFPAIRDAACAARSTKGREEEVGGVCDRSSVQFKVIFVFKDL